MKFIALVVVAALWFLAQAAAQFGTLPPGAASAAGLIAAAPGLLAPVMLLLLGWILTDLVKGLASREPETDEGEASAVDLRSIAREVDGALDEVSAKATRIRDDMSEQAKAIRAAATRLDRAGVAALEGGTAIGSALAQLDERLPPLLKSADDAETALVEATVSMEAQIAAFADRLETMREQSSTIADDAAQAVGRMTAALSQIDTVSEHTTQLVANRAYALDGAVTGVLERSVVTLDTIRESLLAQGQAIEKSVRQARQELEGCGQQSAAEIAERLDGLIARAQALEAQVQDSEQRAMALMSHMESWMADAGSRLDGLHVAATAQIDGLRAGLQEAHENAEDAIGRLGSAQDAATTLQELTAGFQPTLEAFDGSVSARLPMMEQALGRVATQSDEVSRRVEQLAATVGACAERLEGLARARAEEQEKLDALVARFMAAGLK